MTGRPSRSFRLPTTDFNDGGIEAAKEIRRDSSFRICVRARRDRDASGEGTGDGTALPRRRAMDEGMLEEYSVLRGS